MEFLKYALAFILMFFLVSGLCRLLRFKPNYIKIDKPRRSALCSLVAVSVSWLILFSLVMLSVKHTNTASAAPSVKHHRDLMSQVLIVVIYGLPILLMLRLNGEKLQSIGLTRTNIGKAIIIGLFFAAMSIPLAHKGPGAVFKITQDHNLYSLIYFSLVGFGEEILYRGYLQTRLVSWLGYYQGLFISTIIFAFTHLPIWMLTNEMGFAEALKSVLLGIIPVSLLMGLVMLRTGTIIPGSIFHTFIDWVNAG